MIEFLASLKNGKCIKIDNENAAEIVLSASASEIAEIIKLVTLSGKAFRVMIEETKK